VNLAEPPPEGAGLFGTDFDPDNDTLVVIGVPWEPTTSYGKGASLTPERIIAASHQLDFYMPAIDGNYGAKVGMLPPNPDWIERNRRCLALAAQVRAGGPDRAAALREINRASEDLTRELHAQTAFWLDRGKRVAVLGGDHAAPLGHMSACLERCPGASVLHIDAHHDLREAYEGFTHSHASIMFNLLRDVPQVGKLVSVGIRDYCLEERRYAEAHEKVTTFYDRDLAFAASAFYSATALIRP